MMEMPNTPKQGGNVLAWAQQVVNHLRANRITDVRGGQLKRTPSGTIIDVSGQRNQDQRNTQSPFTVNIYKDGVNWKVWLVDGKVITRANGSGDAVGSLSVTSIATKSAPLAVIDGDKLTVKIDTDTDGLVTAATLVKTNGAWPTSTATELASGDIAGTVGFHHVRIASIDASATDSAYLNVNQVTTGHVDHFQPILCENATPSASNLVTGEARVMQKFKLSTGEWVFRVMAPADGGGAVEFAEDGDKLRGNTTGATFIVNIWQTDITFISGGPGSLEIDNGLSPLATFYVWYGVWYDSQPTGYPDPAGVAKYNVSYVTPTTGGP
jgi:hypothetical protein